MVKDGRYSLYNGSTENYDLTCLLKGSQCKTEEHLMPNWKSNFEVFTSHTIDNLMEIASIADVLGLKNANPLLKTIVALIILFLPIIIATVYLIATTRKEKVKFD